VPFVFSFKERSKERMVLITRAIKKLVYKELLGSGVVVVRKDCNFEPHVDIK